MLFVINVFCLSPSPFTLHDSRPLTRFTDFFSRFTIHGFKKRAGDEADLDLRPAVAMAARPELDAGERAGFAVHALAARAREGNNKEGKIA